MTKPITTRQIDVRYIDHMGHDLRTVDAARVSMKKRSEWEKPGTVDSDPILNQKDAKLIDYLGRHLHKSPFNHNALTVYVKAPIFVARQLVKHEYLVMNEVSRRYVDDELEFYKPEAWRERAANKKQGSGGPLDDFKSSLLYRMQEESHQDSIYRYQYALDLGLAPEQARAFLPQDLMTEWYWTGFLGAWAKMVNLRDHPDAQQEAREVALKVDAITRDLWPHSWEALRKYNVR